MTKKNQRNDPGRSANMRSIRSKDTGPEMVVRRMVHALGYRFRLHLPTLPGRPDLAFPPRHKVIEVRGCFWHQHADPNCGNALMPSTRRDYWAPKLARNRERDANNMNALASMGWKTLVLWECELADRPRIEKRIRKFLK